MFALQPLDDFMFACFESRQRVIGGSVPRTDDSVALVARRGVREMVYQPFGVGRDETSILINETSYAYNLGTNYGFRCLWEGTENPNAKSVAIETIPGIITHA